MDLAYTASFLRMLGKLPLELQEEAIEKIDLFRDLKNHQQLKVHALRGQLIGRYSFSVNYKTRIVFKYLSKSSKEEVLLTAIGDHDVYR